MDLLSRKYNFIEEFITIDNEIVLNKLEKILKEERKLKSEISIEHKKILSERLDSYKENPEKTIDWQMVKNDW
jgi:Putative addiction module component